jgi:RHS repeat-associated protein
MTTVLRDEFFRPTRCADPTNLVMVASQAANDGWRKACDHTGGAPHSPTRRAAGRTVTRFPGGFGRAAQRHITAASNGALADGAGDPMAAADGLAPAVPADGSAFDEFGMPIERGTVTRAGFTGHQHDDELGLIDMKGRIYDRLAAQFTSADPLLQAPFWSQGLNRYSSVFTAQPGSCPMSFGNKID